MQAIGAGQNFIGGLGRVTPRVINPRMAGRTGANVRGAVLDSYLGSGRRDALSIRLGGRGLGDGFNACTDTGYRAAAATTTALMDVVSGFLNTRAGTAGTDSYDRGFADASRATAGAAAVYNTAYEAACATPETDATSPTVGSPTNAEITAMLTATREELARTRTSATEAEMERTRAEAAATQRTQQYLMIGGGVALLALVAFVALK